MARFNRHYDDTQLLRYEAGPPDERSFGFRARQGGIRVVFDDDIRTTLAAQESIDRIEELGYVFEGVDFEKRFVQFRAVEDC